MRIVSTMVAIGVLILLLSGIRNSVFAWAPEKRGAAESRPIFLDVIRFGLIAVGAGLIFAYIWGANVGGLFTALGIGSIVIGLTLQNSVGQIISGLLMLFEQPFRIGDWIQTDKASGRVVEVNWRAVHLETPRESDHPQLGARRAIVHQPEPAARPARNPRRHRVRRRGSARPGVRDAGPRRRAVTRVPSRSDAGRSPYRRSSVPPRFRCGHRPTTATRRLLSCAGSGMPPDVMAYISMRPTTSSPTRTWWSRRSGPLFRPPAAGRRSTGRDGRAPVIERYGAGELILSAGVVPEAMSFIVSGRVLMTADGARGSRTEARTLDEGAYFGQSTLVRHRRWVSYLALDEVAVIRVARDAIEEVVQRNPLLLENSVGRSRNGA